MRVDSKSTISNSVLAFGGARRYGCFTFNAFIDTLGIGADEVGSHAVRAVKTEAFLKGKPLNAETFAGVRGVFVLILVIWFCFGSAGERGAQI